MEFEIEIEIKGKPVSAAESLERQGVKGVGEWKDSILKHGTLFPTP